MKLMGIDYGGKLNGTTAICYNSGSELIIIHSTKNQNADSLIINTILSENPGILAIDAPLSLPAGLLSPGADNYFHRKCDTDLQAMSPMFLGGLTARAIKLTNELLLDKPGLKILETYPRKQYDRIKTINGHYKKSGEDPNQLSSILENELKNLFKIPHLASWHAFDACLCWLTAFRYSKNICISYGKESEGQIYI